MSDPSEAAPARPARLSTADLTRPPTGPWDATTSLLDFAIVTYAVDPGVLARHLPPGFAPDVYRLDDGSQVAFISAVPFRDADFRFHFAPFYKVAMGQTNYRAYVLYEGRRVVWFFGTTLSGFWVNIPRVLWRLPWHRAAIDIDASYREGVCESYSMAAESDWGPASLQMRGTPEPMGRLDGFADAEDTLAVLTHPLVGFYGRRDGSLGSYSVWHDRLEPRRADVAQASFPVFERLGLIEPGAAPHSAVIQAQTEFTIFLPPRVVGPRLLSDAVD